MKNILLINKTLTVGGIESVVVSQYYTFKQLNINVSILLFKDDVKHKIPKSDITIISDKSKSIQNYFNLNNNFDLIICHVQSSRICSYIKKSCKNNLLFVIHGTLSNQLDNKSLLSKFFRKNKLQKVYKNQNIVSVSNSVKNDLEKLNIKPKKTKVIYNPFNTQHILLKASESINNTFLESKKPYIIWVGRIDKVKNLFFLINIFKYLQNNLNLVIVGDGDETLKTKLKKQIKDKNLEDKVLFTGFTQNPYKYIKHSQALILTSHHEGFGNVLIEALLLGKPAFSVNIPTSIEILQKYFPSGLFDKNETPKEIAKHILNTLNKNTEISCNEIEDNFSNIESTQQYLNYFSTNDSCRS